MQLTVSYISPVSQQDIEVSIKQLDIYIILMLYNAVFSNQWWGRLASWIGNYFGTKFWHRWNGGIQRVWNNRNAKHGLKRVCNIIKNWRHYFALLPGHRWLKQIWHSNPGGRIRTRLRNSLGTVSFHFFTAWAWRIYLHGRWLPWIMAYSVRCFLNL